MIHTYEEFMEKKAHNELLFLCNADLFLHMKPNTYYVTEAMVPINIDSINFIYEKDDIDKPLKPNYTLDENELKDMDQFLSNVMKALGL